MITLQTGELLPIINYYKGVLSRYHMQPSAIADIVIKHAKFALVIFNINSGYANAANDRWHLTAGLNQNTNKRQPARCVLFKSCAFNSNGWMYSVAVGCIRKSSGTLANYRAIPRFRAGKDTLEEFRINIWQILKYMSEDYDFFIKKSNVWVYGECIYKRRVWWVHIALIFSFQLLRMFFYILPYSFT